MNRRPPQQLTKSEETGLKPIQELFEIKRFFLIKTHKQETELDWRKWQQNCLF